jgi:hypothetical protein
MTWYLTTADGERWAGQPDEGFSGPGRAYNWLLGRGLAGRFGTELFVVSDEGTRPSVHLKDAA